MSFARDKAAELRTARLDGEKARLVGRPLLVNPYLGYDNPGDMDLKRAWSDGWVKVDYDLRLGLDL